MITTNKYGSLLNTFIADILSIAFPVTPPAALNVASSSFTTSYLSFRNASGRVVAFNKIDVPYIRGIGLFSNLADGLVNASTSNIIPGSTPWGITLVPRRFGAALSGTVANILGTNTFTGTGTKFLSELTSGQTFVFQDYNGVYRTHIVAAIASNTLMTISGTTSSAAPYAGTITISTLYPFVGGIVIANSTSAQIGGTPGYAGSSINIPFVALNNVEDFSVPIIAPGLIYPPQGRITAVVGSPIIIGVGTNFYADYAAGSIFAYNDDMGIRNTYLVQAVQSPTQLTLTSNIFAPPNGSGSATSLPILQTLDDHIRIEVSYSSGNFGAYTITIDPAFAGKNFVISPMVVIEQTFAMNSILSP